MAHRDIPNRLLLLAIVTSVFTFATSVRAQDTQRHRRRADLRRIKIAVEGYGGVCPGPNCIDDRSYHSITIHAFRNSADSYLRNAYSYSGNDYADAPLKQTRDTIVGSFAPPGGIGRALAAVLYPVLYPNVRPMAIVPPASPDELRKVAAGLNELMTGSKMLAERAREANAPGIEEIRKAHPEYFRSHRLASVRIRQNRLFLAEPNVFGPLVQPRDYAGGSNLPRMLDVKTVAVALDELEGLLPGQSLLGLSVDAHFHEGEDTLAAPIASYSNSPGSYDVTVTPFLSGSDGYAIAVHEDLSPSRRKLISARTRLRAQIRARRAEAVRSDPPAQSTAVYDIRKLVDAPGGVADAFNRNVLATRFGVFGGYQDFGDDASAQSAGLSVSRLLALGNPDRPVPGLLLSAAAEGTQVEVFGHHRSSVRPGVQIAIQDKVPRLVRQTGSAVEYRLHRWKWQTGFDYQFRDALSRDDSYAVFLRYRHEPDVDYTYDPQSFYRRATEFTLSVGKAPGDEWYVGVRVGKFFSF